MPKTKPRFIPYNFNQNAMVVIDYQDQLQPGTFEHAVHYHKDSTSEIVNGR